MLYYERLRQKTRRIYLTPEDFLKACADYFEWCEEHPLREEEIFHNRGAIVRTDKSKVRAFTKKGLATFLNITESRITGFKNRGDKWEEAVEMVEQIIHIQKFENAAAGLLNASIISRDLGLAERQELTGADGGPIKTEETSVRERIAGKLNGLAARAREDSDPSGTE